MNLGRNVRDDTEALAENRRRFERFLPASPTWLEQVHGAAVVTLHGGARACRVPSPTRPSRANGASSARC